MYAREYFESGNVIKANPVLAMYRPLRFAMFFITIVLLALIIALLFLDGCHIDCCVTAWHAAKNPFAELK